MKVEERATASRAPVVRTSRNNWLQICRTCSLPPERRIDPVSRWLIVTRACVQPMTLTAGAIAGLLALRHPEFNAWLYGLAVLGLVAAHAANNMINDYFDLAAGLDTSDYPRTLYAPHPVAGGLVTQQALLRAIVLVNAFDALVMLTLFVARGWPVVAFALAGLAISVFYVAPPLRLKAHALGEPGVALVWGPLMVGGTYYSATGEVSVAVILASVPYALLVMSVLMGKHIDKAPWDAHQEMHTLPVLLGDERARRVTVALMLSFYVVVAALVVTGLLPVWALLVGLALPRFIKVLHVYSRPKPTGPPAGYPLWPLWFVSAAFVHARRAGALFVVGLLVGAISPLSF